MGGVHLLEVVAHGVLTVLLLLLSSLLLLYYYYYFLCYSTCDKRFIATFTFRELCYLREKSIK